LRASEKPSTGSGASQRSRRAPPNPHGGGKPPGKTAAGLSSGTGLRQSPGHPDIPSNPGLRPQSRSSPSVCHRSHHRGVPGRRRRRSASRFLLTDPQLQSPHALQPAPQLGAGLGRDGGQLGKLLHPPQAAPQPGQVLLGGEGARGQSGTRKYRSRKPGSSRTRCRRPVVSRGAASGCAPPSCPRPGEWVLLAGGSAGGSAGRPSEGGVRGRVAAGGEGLAACGRAEQR